jgi:hypothetical protein
MASAKKSAGKKSAKSPARKPAKPARAKSAAKPAKATSAKAAKGDVVYSDLRRDALAWQLNKIR